jgi:hypothetical protein
MRTLVFYIDATGQAGGFKIDDYRTKDWILSNLDRTAPGARLESIIYEAPTQQEAAA